MKSFALLVVLLFVGCNTTDKAQKSFKSSLDWCVSYKKPISVCSDGILEKEVTENEGYSYHYRYAGSKHTDMRCKWVVYTNDRKIVKGWKYVSDSRYCYRKFSWAAPW